MAFCTSCGQVLEGNAQFCTKCGARQTGARSAGGGAAPAPAPSAGSNQALKIVLIIIAGVILLGAVVSVATFVFIGKKLHDAKVSVREHDGEATVVTPMGTVHTSKDAGKIADSLGMDIYPGAKSLEGGSDAEIMGMHVVTGVFQTDDAPDKVAAFYKERMPKAIYTESNGEYTLVSGGHGSRDMTTVNIKEEGGHTQFTLVRNTGRPTGGRDSKETN